MTIQLGRTRPIEQIQYPGRKDGGGVSGHIHKFWAPKHQQQQQQSQSFVKSKTPQPTATKSTIITSTKNQQQQSEPQSNSKPQQQQSNPKPQQQQSNSKLQPQQLSNPKPLTAASVKSKTPQPTTAIIQPTQNQNQQPQQSIPKPLQAFMKSKTPQPTTKSTIASQKKVVSFWETQTSSNSSVLGRNVKTSTSLINTCSKSMSSLNQDQPEIEEKRGFIPSEVAKDPMKKEFLINLSKKIFSPNDQSKRRKSLKESSITRQKMLDSTLLGDGGIPLSKVMTPVQDYDSNSLKRRNPRQMFTDSAFYSPKFHPSVAEQVEMAHKLSSSLFDDGNKTSKGQDMFLKRSKKSGEILESEPIEVKHDKTPNLKLVMNPEGKLHDWNDLPEEEVPDELQVAYQGNPEIAKTLVEGMNNCKGRGKNEEDISIVFPPPPTTTAVVLVASNVATTTYSKPSPSFAGSFRQVFDSRRGMFEKKNNLLADSRMNNTSRFNTHHYTTTSKNFPPPYNNNLVRSKTLPDIPTLDQEDNNSGISGLKRPAGPTLQASPVVPKRSSSKQMVETMLNDDPYCNRRPLRNFFSNA